MTGSSYLPGAALYRIEEIRQIEAAANANLPPGNLMRAAGSAAANLAKRLILKQDRKVLILAGPGNNGGDALEVAHLLSTAGVDVSVLLCGNVDEYSFDAQQSLRRAKASKAKFIDIECLAGFDRERWALVIDGLFGIGLTRAITGQMASLIQQVNHLSQTYRLPVLALDMPSGLNADTGQIIGDSGVAVHATHTITFIGNKPGLHTAGGKDFCGQVELADLGISPIFFPPPDAYLSHPHLFSTLVKPRQHDSNKGSYGDVWIIGGATGMAGAPLLAGRSAIHCGAGRVYVGFIGSPPLFDSQHPELMCRDANECAFSTSVVVIGPGLGDTAEAEQLLSRALSDAMSLVIDADALNLIAKKSALQTLVQARCARNAITIMTPHPLEAARLMGVSSKQIQSDRWKSARDLAKKFNACIILKGAGTITANMNEPLCINTNGNPALATAGTGDVLAGICGALLAQHVGQADAARFAVWLHGAAADMLVTQGVGPIGLTASELIPAIRSCMNDFIAESNNGK
ncbi:MAG: NAD(P)H-hydrate dehydratase [Undibacterium sp.]|nr:NAD(P)H-hydrate dehydratase [Undibacterium sp.]